MTKTERQRIKQRAAQALAHAERQVDTLCPRREPKLIVIDPTAKREKLKLDINSAPVLGALYSLLSDIRARRK